MASTWNPNIPQPRDKLYRSQSDLLGNNQAVVTMATFADGSMMLPQQGGEILFDQPTISQGSIALYAYPRKQAIQGPGTPFPPPVYSAPNNAFVVNSSGEQYPITSYSNLFKQFVPSLLLFGMNDGYCYLPSGILLKWGSSVRFPKRTTDITFVVSEQMPGFKTAPYAVIIGNAFLQSASRTSNNDWTIVKSSLNAVGFKAKCGPGTAGNPVPFNYLAIGR
jgi:hypothetical protein